MDRHQIFEAHILKRTCAKTSTEIQISNIQMKTGTTQNTASFKAQKEGFITSNLHALTIPRSFKSEFFSQWSLRKSTCQKGRLTKTIVLGCVV